MFEYGEKIIYFIPTVNTGKLLIIDAIGKNIIEKIEIGSGQQNIFIDENDNVYITNDINILIINNFCHSSKTFNIPNNGNIQVDVIGEKIYVGNTEEIYICNLETGEKIISISGFAAADRMELDKDKKRLFILDILKKEIKIYDTEKYKLIDTYKDIGMAPCDIVLEEDGKYIYIANKGLRNKYYRCTINILDIDTKKISKIDMKKGADIKSLEQGGNYLYAANRGFNRIDVIDIQKKQPISEIKPKLPIMDRIRISKDKKMLFAISRNNDGLSAIDIIDTDSFIIRDTLSLEAGKFYDIGIIIQEESQNNKESANEKEPVVFMKLEDKFEEVN